MIYIRNNNPFHSAYQYDDDGLQTASFVSGVAAYEPAMIDKLEKLSKAFRQDLAMGTLVEVKAAPTGEDAEAMSEAAKILNKANKSVVAAQGADLVEEAEEVEQEEVKKPARKSSASKSNDDAVAL